MQSSWDFLDDFLFLFSGKVNEGKYDVGSWGIERLDVYGADGEIVGNSSNVLAAQRTYRRDPLNNFEKYDGGWNISEHHYWAVSSFHYCLFISCILITFPKFMCQMLAVGKRNPISHTQNPLSGVTHNRHVESRHEKNQAENMINRSGWTFQCFNLVPPTQLGYDTMIETLVPKSSSCWEEEPQ